MEAQGPKGPKGPGTQATQATQGARGPQGPQVCPLGVGNPILSKNFDTPHFVDPQWIKQKVEIEEAPPPSDLRTEILRRTSLWMLQMGP